MDLAYCKRCEIGEHPEKDSNWTRDLCRRMPAGAAGNVDGDGMRESLGEPL